MDGRNSKPKERTYRQVVEPGAVCDEGDVETCTYSWMSALQRSYLKNRRQTILHEQSVYMSAGNKEMNFIHRNRNQPRKLRWYVQ